MLWDVESSPKQVSLHNGNIAGYRLADLEPLPPACATPLLQQKKMEGMNAICLLRDGPLMPVEESSARNAYIGLTIPRMKEYANHVGLVFEAGKEPRTEKEWVLALLKNQLPSRTEEEVKSVLALRFESQRSAIFSTTFSEQNLAMGETIMESSAIELAKEIVKRHSKSEKTPVAKNAAKKKEARKPRKMKVPNWKIFSEEEFKRLLPVAAGCVGTKDTKLHFRFEASYPTEHPPYSFSAAWNENRSEKEAALACLRWAWARHEDAGKPGPTIDLE